MDNRPRQKTNHESRRVYRGLALILIIAILSFTFLSPLRLFETFAEWLQEHGIAAIDGFMIGFSILTFAFGIFSLRKWRKLQKALANLKTLHGLLPLCASCKKIRDDKGYWNQLETYIQNHSDAEITHGICPDCMKQLYGDFLEKDSIPKRNIIRGEGTV